MVRRSGKWPNVRPGIGPMIRRAIGRTKSAATATHMVCATAGTTSIFNSSPLERYARDAEVVTRHNQLQFVNYEAVGRTMLGLESNSPLF